MANLIMGRTILRLFFTTILSVFLVSCDNTDDQITAMDQHLSEQRLKAATSLANQLIKDPKLEHAGDVQLYISSNLFKQVFTLFDKLTISISEMPGVTFTINSIRPVFSEGIASLAIDLSAKKGTATIQVLGTATLVPESLPDAVLEKEVKIIADPIPKEVAAALGIKLNPISIQLPSQKYKQKQPLQFHIIVDQLAPRVSWGPFSSDIKDFVADFARIKLNEFITAKLPAIEVPLENVIAINKNQEVKPLPLMDGKLKSNIVTPPVAWSTSFSLTEVVVFPRGIHLIGTLSNAGASK